MGKRLDKAQKRLEARKNRENEAQSKMLDGKRRARKMPGSMKK